MISFGTERRGCSLAKPGFHSQNTVHFFFYVFGKFPWNGRQAELWDSRDRNRAWKEKSWREQRDACTKTAFALLAKHAL